MTKLIQVVDCFVTGSGEVFQNTRGRRGGAISRWVEELYILILSLAS